MKKFTVKEFKFEDIRDNVVLPSFQRSYVWSKTKKNDLIGTIKQGLPIGTVLLSMEGNNYKIIDGLQRIATLKDFQKDPFNYLDETEVSTQQIEEILTCTERSSELFGNYNSGSKKKLVQDTKSLAVKKIKENADLDINDRSWKITEEIIKETSILEESDNMNVQKKIFSLLNNINEILDIGKYELPAIVFTGSDSELVKVFTLLNSKGTKLSKYDVYAAEWSNIAVKDMDDEIIEVVIKRHESSIEKSGIEISDFSPLKFKNEKVVNVFEYAYAIGKLIGNKSKLLFKKKEDELVDSLGFTVLSGIFNVTNKEMFKLSEQFKNKDLDYSELKNKIIKVTKEIEKILTEYISSHKKERNYSSHSEFQLASYIITLFRLQYEFKDGRYQKSNKYNKEITRFKNNLPIHYVYDIYRNFWSGSGDTALDNLVIDSEDQEHNENIINSRYLSIVPKNDFISTIRSWLNEENLKNKSNISREIKLFHCCIINSRLVKTDSYKMDFDHIVPKYKFKFLNNGNKNEVPISSPCNITMIPEFDNRKKKELTYYELEDSKKGLSHTYDKKELEKFNYPKREELGFIHFKNLTKDNYFEFIENRKEKIVNDFVGVFYK